MTIIKYIHICSEMIELIWEQTQFNLRTNKRMAWNKKEWTMIP